VKAVSGEQTDREKLTSSSIFYSIYLSHQLGSSFVICLVCLIFGLFRIVPIVAFAS